MRVVHDLPAFSCCPWRVFHAGHVWHGGTTVAASETAVTESTRACNVTLSDGFFQRYCSSTQHGATYHEDNCCLNRLHLRMTPWLYVYFEAHPSSTTSASPGCTDPCLAAWPSGVTRNTLQPSLRRGPRLRRCSSPCLRALSSSTIASSSSPSDPGSKATKVQATGGGRGRV